jgi:hypothetical protein
LPGERVARLTIAVASIQDALAKARALVGLRLVMRRRLLTARRTAAEAPRIVTSGVARARFLTRPDVVVGVSAVGA